MSKLHSGANYRGSLLSLLSSIVTELLYWNEMDSWESEHVDLCNKIIKSG